MSAMGNEINEMRVGAAIIDVLANCANEDIKAGIGWIFQEPRDAKALALQRALGRAAIGAMHNDDA